MQWLLTPLSPLPSARKRPIPYYRPSPSSSSLDSSPSRSSRSRSRSYSSYSRSRSHSRSHSRSRSRSWSRSRSQSRSWSRSRSRSRSHHSYYSRSSYDSPGFWNTNKQRRSPVLFTELRSSHDVSAVRSRAPWPLDHYPSLTQSLDQRGEMYFDIAHLLWNWLSLFMSLSIQGITGNGLPRVKH